PLCLTAMHLSQPMQALPDPILEPATLEAMLDSPDLLVVDLCQPQVWRQLHIPGAVHVDPGMLVSGTPPVPGMLPTPARLRALLASIGYSPTRHIVAYDDEGGGWAGRFLWTLDMIGHPRWSYLNGGLHAWYKENHPVGTEQAEAPEPTDFDLQLDPRPIAELETVLAALDDPGVVIWDARSPEEFAG